MRAYRFAERVLSPARDSAYIDVQNYNWCAMTQLTQRFEMCELDAGDDFTIRVQPKVRTRVGPFFGWRWAFLGYNIDIKSVFMNDTDVDLGGSVYSAAFGIDAFYRRVGSDYRIRRLTIGERDYSDCFGDRTFDGIKRGLLRVSLNYVPGYRRYSHQAAFSQTNRQLRSAGSAILGFTYAHNSTSIDWQKVATALHDSGIDDDFTSAMQSGEGLKNDEFSFSAGYGYNWVFSRNWLLAGELMGGIGYLWQSRQADREIHHFSDIYRKNIAFNGNLRCALLWNNGPLFAGMQAVAFYYQYGNGTMMTRNMLGTAYLYVGVNF